MTSEERLQAEVQQADAEAAHEPVSTRTVYRWGVAGALGVLTVFLAYRAVLLVTDILVQVLIAVFIAVSLDPAVRWLIQRRAWRGQARSPLACGARGPPIPVSVRALPPRRV